jgi:hypothetical protein
MIENMRGEKEVFDKEYENTRGYPMTDRTYGTALSFKF